MARKASTLHQAPGTGTFSCEMTQARLAPPPQAGGEPPLAGLARGGNLPHGSSAESAAAPGGHPGSASSPGQGVSCVGSCKEERWVRLGSRWAWRERRRSRRRARKPALSLRWSPWPCTCPLHWTLWTLQNTADVLSNKRRGVGFGARLCQPQALGPDLAAPPTDSAPHHCWQKGKYSSMCGRPGVGSH